MTHRDRTENKSLLAAGARIKGRWHVVVVQPTVRAGTGTTLAEALVEAQRDL